MRKSSLDIIDQAGNFKIHCEGVTPRKIPDRTCGQASPNLTRTLLCARITEA